MGFLKKRTDVWAVENLWMNSHGFRVVVYSRYCVKGWILIFDIIFFSTISCDMCLQFGRKSSNRCFWHICIFWRAYFRFIYIAVRERERKSKKTHWTCVDRIFTETQFVQRISPTAKFSCKCYQNRKNNIWKCLWEHRTHLKWGMHQQRRLRYSHILTWWMKIVWNQYWNIGNV